jgi:hypothetical protein
LAIEVERIWRQVTPQPLAFVGGDGDILLGVVAYAADKPRALLGGLAAPSAAHLRRAGMALLCFTGDQTCLNEARRVAGSAPSSSGQISITQKSWGTLLAPRSYTIIVVPPQA